MKNTLTFFALILFVFAGRVFGQPAGSLDLTFNGTGKVVYDRDKMDVYQDVKVQNDGKIIAVGISYTPSYSSVIEVSRYLTDGSFDPSFGTGGHFNYSTGIETGANKCIINDDSTILVCGYTTDYATYSMFILKLKADGTLDPSFGTNGVCIAETSPAEKNVFGMTMQGDGKILLAGYSVNGDYRNAPVLLRFTASGALDTSFGTNGIATIPVTESDNDFSAVAVQSDGKIVAAGHISNGLSWFSLLIARFDTSGALDAGYGTAGVVNMNLNNVDDEFFGMKLTSENEAILTGFTVSQSNMYYHLLLMKFDVNGQPVTSFGTNGSVVYGNVPYTVGNSMALQADGKILIAGCTGQLQPSNNDWALWRFNSNGSPDAGFGTNGLVTTDFFGNADEALGIALHLDKIVLAGKTRNATDYLDFAVARYDNDFNVLVPVTSAAQDISIFPNPVKCNGTLRLDFEFQQSGNITLEILNFTGSVTAIIPLGDQIAGPHSIKIGLPFGISAGMYFLRIKGSLSGDKTMKLIVTD